MPERLKQIPDEIWNFIFKTLPFAMAAIAISVAVQVKNKTATFLGVFLSVVIGISCAWITGGFINAHFSTSSAPIIIGVVTIAGEKTGYWLVYKFNFDLIGQAFIDYVLTLLKRKK
jgi:hypothetical protein